MKATAALFSIVYFSMLLSLSAISIDAISYNYYDNYDYMVLTQTWPPTFCTFNKCLGPIIRDNFTIHGLWDNYVPPSFRSYPCSSQISFDLQLVASIKPSLEKNWPSLISIYRNEGFWACEWTKHGSCITNDVKSYFDSALYWKNAFNILQILGTKGIISGRKYSKRIISNVIRRGVKFDVVLKCLPRGSQQYLWEVVLCINRQGSHLISCKGKNYTAGTYQCQDRKYIIIPA
ncbi:hypothetical protein vseg_011359 [Gypsophila vaccaria]